MSRECDVLNDDVDTDWDSEVFDRPYSTRASLLSSVSQVTWAEVKSGVTLMLEMMGAVVSVCGMSVVKLPIAEALQRPSLLQEVTL